MRLVFWAEASPEMGSGHVMRLSSIAEEAIGRDIKCHFIGEISNIPWLEARISTLGFEPFPPNYTSDSSECILFTDSYSLEATQKQLSRHKWSAVVSIVDPESPLLPADLYIHPGLDGSWYKGDRSNFLFGPKYIPIRQSLASVNRQKSKVNPNIVIVGGGTDPTNFAIAMAKILHELSGFGECIFITNSPSEILYLDSRFQTRPFGTTLDDVLTNADLVFSSASSVSFEVAARGIPIGIACLVSNQLSNYESLQNIGAATQIGIRDATGSNYLNVGEISSLISSQSKRTSLAEQAKVAFDFLGSSRILDAVLEFRKFYS